jgi:hypothetical protein
MSTLLKLAAVAAPEPEDQPAPVFDLVALFDEARARANRWPEMEFRNFDGAWKREPCWRKIIDVVLSEVQIPPALVEMFAAPLPTVLPPRQDLVLAMRGVDLAAQVLDARPQEGRMWALKLWVFGPAGCRIAEPAAEA